MSDRYTEKDVVTSFRIFCKRAGIPCAHQYPVPVGAYGLDKGTGGYRVIQIMENGGQHTPFGALRRTAKEMTRTLDFAADAFDLARKES